MKPTLKDFLDLLETAAPAHLAEEWDNPGLQVGSLSQEISRVLVCLDPTYRALVFAGDAGAQLLFTHHPLIFHPLPRLDTDAFPGDVAAEAIRRGISVVAAHTNLDAAREGINHILGDLLGLAHMDVLEDKGQVQGAGLGRIGDLSRPMKLSSLAERVREAVKAQRVRVVGRPEGLISRVAVVGGSGGSLLSRAHQKGAHLLITGDVGHHVALEAESLGIAVIDAGHFHTERTAFTIFADTLKRMGRAKGWELTFLTHMDETDPVWIYPP